MIISAYMVPHPPIAVHEIGKGEEKKIQHTIDAYEQVGKMIAEDHPDTIVITSPHATMYRDWFNVSSGSHAYGDFGQFRCPEVSFDETYDEEDIYFKMKCAATGNCVITISAGSYAQIIE